MGTKTAAKTVADAQGDIAALHREQKQLQLALTQIEQQIADNWNGDNGELEASYALKQARLNASGKVLERLQHELKVATESDMLKQYRQRVKEYFPVETAAIEAKDRVEVLEQELAAARKDYQEKVDRVNGLRASVIFAYPMIPAHYRNAGIKAEEFSAIYSEEYQKYQEKLEKVKTA